MGTSDHQGYSREYNIYTNIYHLIIRTKKEEIIKKTSFMKPANSPISTYKYYNTYEDIIDPPYLPTSQLEKDLKFNYSEPRRSLVSKNTTSRQKQNRNSGFLDYFCEVLCCFCHILEVFN